ncbi:SRPBCC family protein [Rhodococcus sp. BP-149]|uniref:SRPBCC family protein n=1 Tax=unclassified Rhodococcus (in: high G+C Gram-positive bacteria) TaxID=192944 RepID=UPI001C9A6740|nr:MULTISPECIES: SRPBCC family protein [unclassified Rhodococcus (in: high G+C Gram-positive bacteria)]MBY6687618.1 SRPBCC family protein [Rhodococcus sp. BP-288]MBY6695783.1 SRPBCC family protein [Rhodococcus sp. BP-188]MBY6700419.1 SRPBCC family protein [Rhodococcus sp. BP-285]MBY6704558.1 SRPBCC family protein [Rhodococcus sp. BP-283]MBY6713544.1 SRPBCC family protein [Rhodococcus sp. BP-160]
MAKVSASSSLTISAAPDKVLAALSDYETVRPRILPEQYRDFAVVEGGQGDGTVARWVLQATEKRSRSVLATVSVSGATVTEKDANSSMVTTYLVAPSGSGSSVTTTTEWTGAGGVGGFFEKTFAPLGLKKIQAQLLQNLSRQVE